MSDPQDTPDDAYVTCEIDGHKCLYEILTYLREKGEMTVAEYQEEYTDAPLVHPDVLTFLKSATIYLDAEGIPWRTVSKFDKLGFQAYGPIISHKTSPRADPLFEFSPKVTKLLYFAFEANQRPLLVGPPSTGKSELARNMCAALGWGFRRVNFNGQATPRTLFGTPRAGAGGETYFLYGAVPLAMRGNDGKGECLLLDEISFIDPDMSAGLHPVMEPNGCLTLLENGGEIIEPGPLFRIVGTDNVGMQGDLTGTYHGTKPINAAFMDRWSMQIKVEYLDKDTEIKVLTSKTPGLPRVVAEIMCDLASESRTKVATGNRDIEEAEVLNPVTFRQLMDWAALAIQHRSIRAGWVNAVLNKSSEEDAVALETLFAHKFPELAEET